MITTDEDLAEVIRSGGYVRDFVADVIVDDERVLSDIPLASCELKSDGNAKVRTQGTAVLVYSDELGRSVVPEDLTSWLTPYATVLNVSYRVSLNGIVWKVLQGTLKVAAVGDPQETRVLAGGRLLTVGSRVKLTLADAFRVTERERFIAPSSPASLDSVWDEIANLTNLPVQRNVADAAIPRSITYQESRLDAVHDLGAVLDGVPYVNPDGEVTIQPNQWPAESEPLRVGPDGTIVDVTPNTLTDEGIYNQVVVRSHENDQTAILATAELETGPLRYGGPFGRVPYFASSQFITTPEQAAEYAANLLPRVSSQPAAQFTIQCAPDPRREVGDVVPFESRDGRAFVGRIVERTLSSSGPMTLKVLVKP